MSRIRKYFPNYQINSREGRNEHEAGFRYGEVYFVAKLPLFGATKTQKTVIQWASQRTPPVMWVEHESPTCPDRGDSFNDPTEPCSRYIPYAMALATLQCLGEKTTRKVKIYFCNVHLSIHQAKKGWLYDVDRKGFFAIEVDCRERPIS